MEYRILGPVEVYDGDREVQVGGGRQRALLGVLLVHANETVSRERLIDELWGDAPPETAATAVQVYVSQLRKVLGRDAIETRPAGYALRLPSGGLDASRFAGLVEAARGEEPARAAGTLREALALWRGTALAGVDASVARPERARLDEQRLEALELRIDADLGLGRHGALVSELDGLVREHPLREHLRAQLMLALYRSGRQADALAVYRDGRAQLAEELGLEPGDELRRLERAILEQSPALEPPVPSASEPGARTPRKARAAWVAATVVAVVVAAGALATRPWATPEQDVGADDQVVGLTRSGSVHDTVAVDGTPASLAADSTSLWVGEPGPSRLQSIDLRSGEADDKIPLPSPPGSIAVAGRDVWVASTTAGTVLRVNSATRRVFGPWQLGSAGPAAIAYGESGLWAIDATDRTLVRLDPLTGGIDQQVTLSFTPTALAVDRSLWVVDYDGGMVHEIDPAARRELGSSRVGNGPAAVAVGADAVWVANSLDGTVSRIDPETYIPTSIAVGEGPAAVVVSQGSVWVANRYSGTVARIDPSTSRVVGRVRVGSRPAALAAAGGRVWAGSGTSGAEHRGGTLVLSTQDQGWSYSADPAEYEFALPTQFTGLAYDTLVTYQHVDGPAGLQLVPDLAIAIPSPSDAGRTYAFRIRRNIRYSNGRHVLATDFRRAFERLWQVSESPYPSPDEQLPAGAARYMEIVGMDRCAATPGPCDLSDGIVTDDATGTVVFHLRRPDPDFIASLTSFAFSAPIPPGTPSPRSGQIVPGTGPYRMVSRTEQEIRFVRNPYFEEWSAAAQPDGYPDEIVWKLGQPSHEGVVRDIERGQADWTFDLIPPAQLTRLRLHTDRVHVNPWYLFQYIALNPHAAPFDDVRVRRALNFAIDRSKIVALYGGRDVAVPSCQALVPGLPGYEPSCPYTQPSPAGAWRAPDLARARRLVAASGTRGRVVNVWKTNELAIPSQLSAYVASVLRSLGYRTRLHEADDLVGKERQLTVHGDWIPDYPEPSSYLRAFLGCGGPHNDYEACDPAIDRKMALATSLQATDPGRAARLWAEVDRALTDKAWWVPTVTPLGVDLVSSRVGNYRFHPLWGFMAGQAWVR